MRVAGTMATQTKTPNKRLAVLAYDGRDWSAYAFHGGKIAWFREAGAAGSVPSGILTFLREQRIRTARILLPGEVRRLETALPPKLSFAEVSAMLAHEVAGQSGADGTALVCAGGSGSLVGASDPFLLCGAFDRMLVDDLHRQLTEAGLRFDGVGSLELACAAHWNAHRDRETASLVLFLRGHGFMLPARSLPNQPGPVSLSGGLRQVERDPEAWRTRFVRGHRYLSKAGSLSVFALGADVGEIAPILDSIEELPRAEYPDPEVLMAGAAREAALGQANRFGAPVPIRNPHVLRKRFSHAFIVVPCLLVLMSPLALSGLFKLHFHVKELQYQAVVREYGPLEQRIQDAERQRTQAQARHAAAVALQRNLADRRKPLFAFIHLSYFFSKHAGNSVLLESISDLDGTIEVRGVYTDPEDGLSLEAELNQFAADKDLRIVHNRVEERQATDGRVALALELAVDYRELSK